MALTGYATLDQVPPAKARARGRSMALDVAELYRRYGDMVLGRCRSLLRNDADAQEACQEVFLKVHRYQNSFRGDSSPTTWLYRVTTTTCLNKLRSKKRRPEDPHEEPPAIETNDSMLTGHEVRDLVDRVLSLADEKTQACVVHHYVDGMTHKEVGVIVGLSAAAVRKRIGVFKKRIAENPPSWLPDV